MKHPAAILWSLGACVSFGVCNFIIGFTNSIPGQNFWCTLGLIFLTSGLCGIGKWLLLPRTLRSAGIFYHVNAEDNGETAEIDTQGVSSMVKYVTVLGGMLVGLAQLFMKLSFNSDPEDQGPLCSVICADVILVSVMCHVIYGGEERLNKHQWIAVWLVFCGLITMAYTPGEADQSKPSGTSSSAIIIGIFWAVCGMLCFGASVFTIRVGAVQGLSASSGFVARMLSMGLCGAAVLLVMTSKSELQDMFENEALLLLPCLCGVMQGIGVFCINCALVYPGTGISIAIFGSNSLVVLMLTALLQGCMPSTQQLCGMSITVAGCAAMSVAAGSTSSGDEPLIDSSEPARKRQDDARRHSLVNAYITVDVTGLAAYEQNHNISPVARRHSHGANGSTNAKGSETVGGRRATVT